jgi:hypothetical protein
MAFYAVIVPYGSISSQTAIGSRTIRVHHPTEAACAIDSGLHRMQMLACFEPPKFRSGGCSRQWSRSHSGPCPCPISHKPTRLTANASSDRTTSDDTTTNTTPVISLALWNPLGTQPQGDVGWLHRLSYHTAPLVPLHPSASRGAIGAISLGAVG